MMNRLICPMLILLTLTANAMAGTKVLGIEIGTTTYDQVRASLSKQTTVADAGSNKWSGGAMLKAEGGGFDIDGLSSVLCIFDTSERLAGVLLTMRKGDFDKVYQSLVTKYRLTTERRPFVGSQYARFTATDAVVELDAPHLGFDLEVRYLRSDFLKSYEGQQAAEAAARKKKEAAQF